MKIDFSGEEIRLYDFNELESYRIARKLESESINLYRGMQQSADDDAVKEVLGLLLEEEKKHLAFFEGRINELLKSGEVETDLVDIVDSQVFSAMDGMELETILTNPDDVLKLGISAEARTIVFYKKILGSTSDENGRRAIEAIIAEEQKHRTRLESLLGS